MRPRIDETGRLSPLATLRLYARLLKFLRPHLGTLVWAVVFMGLLAAFSGFSIAMIVPFSEIVLSGKTPAEIGPSPGPGTALDLKDRFAERFYDVIRGSDSTETLGRFCLAVILVFFLKNVFWYAQSYLIVRAEQLVIRDIRDRLYDHYQRLSLDYFDTTHSGILIARIINDVELVKGAIANGFAQLIRQTFLLLAYLATVLLASWRLFLIAGVILPPNLWLIERIGHSLRRATHVSQEMMARITGILSESLQGVRIVKAFGLEGEVIRRFRVETQNYAKTLVRMTRLGSLHAPLTEIFGVVLAVAILWFGGRSLVPSEQGTGRFLLFLVGMLSMMQPIKVLSQVNIKIQQGLAAASRIFQILDERPSVSAPEDPAPLPRLHNTLRYEGVGFSYDGDVMVLEDIDLEIPHGAVIAIVGPSGAGKTTLVDLIPRFYDPTRGRLTMDGVDLRRFDPRGLRERIGIVTQETILFNDTVARNVAFGRPGADLREIEAVCRVAHAHGFIEALPGGYDTVIGERGIGLSAGQRQRLSIARALLKNPPLLILDEATSALDTESERLVQDAVSHLLRSRTAIVIAHRLSTIRRADRIIVLDEGRIVQEGSHEELMKAGGLYKKLYEMQFEDTPITRG